MARSGLRRSRRIVVLAEPRRRIAVVAQDAADGRLILRDDAVVAGEAGRLFGDHAEACGVMVAAGDQRCARRRAERRREHAIVSQSFFREPVHCRRRDDAAECARHAEPCVIGDDEKNVWRIGRRRYARRPPGLGLQRLILDDPTELGSGRGKLRAADGCARRCRARRAGHDLSVCSAGCENPTSGQQDQCADGVTGCFSPLHVGSSMPQLNARQPSLVEIDPPEKTTIVEVRKSDDFVLKRQKPRATRGFLVIYLLMCSPRSLRSGLHLSLVDDAPQDQRGRRHRHIVNAQMRERVDERIANCGGRQRNRPRRRPSRPADSTASGTNGFSPRRSSCCRRGAWRSP